MKNDKEVAVEMGIKYQTKMEDAVCEYSAMMDGVFNILEDRDGGEAQELETFRQKMRELFMESKRLREKLEAAWVRERLAKTKSRWGEVLNVVDKIQQHQNRRQDS